MTFWQDPLVGNKIIIMMAAQRGLVTNIRAFGVQSFLLACIGFTIAHFNHAPHIYIAAAMTLVFKAIALPLILERLVNKIEVRQEIAPLVNVPISVIAAGLLTLLAYVVAESFHRPHESPG